jgi:hypothetical protein
MTLLVYTEAVSLGYWSISMKTRPYSWIGDGMPWILQILAKLPILNDFTPPPSRCLVCVSENNAVSSSGPTLTLLSFSTYAARLLRET